VDPPIAEVEFKELVVQVILQRHRHHKEIMVAQVYQIIGQGVEGVEQVQ
jgi:hypothetical protein